MVRLAGLRSRTSPRPALTPPPSRPLSRRPTPDPTRTGAPAVPALASFFYSNGILTPSCLPPFARTQLPVLHHDRAGRVPRRQAHRLWARHRCARSTPPPRPSVLLPAADDPSLLARRSPDGLLTVRKVENVPTGPNNRPKLVVKVVGASLSPPSSPRPLASCAPPWCKGSRLTFATPSLACVPAEQSAERCRATRPGINVDRLTSETSARGALREGVQERRRERSPARARPPARERTGAQETHQSRTA